MSKTFNILQLSDCHFGKDHVFDHLGNDPDSRSLSEAIFAAVDESDLLPIDCLAITGDLFCSEQSMDWVHAEKSLKELFKKLNVEPPNVLVVPGNHDLTWDTSMKKNPLFFYKQLLKNINIETNIDADADILPKIVELETGFNKKVAFVLIDSCRLEGEKTAGYGRVGEKQLDKIRTAIKDKNVCKDSHHIFAIMHHHLLPIWPVYRVWNPRNPQDDIKPLSLSVTVDSRAIMSTLSEIGAHCLFHGHQHHPAIIEYRDHMVSDEKFHILGAGSAGQIEKETKLHFFLHSIKPDEMETWSFYQDSKDTRRFQRASRPVRLPLSSTKVISSSSYTTEAKNPLIAEQESLWQFSNPEKLVVVTSNSSQTASDGYARPATGIGQVRALTSCIESLSVTYEHFESQQILLSSEDLQNRYGNDMIILGGPKTNTVTSLVFNQLQTKQPVSQEGSVIFWREGDCLDEWKSGRHTKYEGTIEDQKVISDYGIIVRVKDPFLIGSKNQAIIFSGSHTYGTVAAAKYFTESLMEKYPEKVKTTDSNFAILIKCKVINQYPICIESERQFFWKHEDGPK